LQIFFSKIINNLEIDGKFKPLTGKNLEKNKQGEKRGYNNTIFWSKA
jgi:hypothetical protein